MVSSNSKKVNIDRYLKLRIIIAVIVALISIGSAWTYHYLHPRDLVDASKIDKEF